MLTYTDAKLYKLQNKVIETKRAYSIAHEFVNSESVLKEAMAEYKKAIQNLRKYAKKMGYTSVLENWG